MRSRKQKVGKSQIISEYVINNKMINQYRQFFFSDLIVLSIFSA